MIEQERTRGRRRIAAVVGAARITGEEEQTALQLGCAIVDAGFRLVTGGLGGTMQAASAGARSSKHYQPGDIIGVLPGYDAHEANAHVDIPICTGMQHGRNTIVAATGDVVFAIGGRSGTLSEIALAWTFGKVVICVGDSEGWAQELAGRQIDDRREDKVHGPLPPDGAVSLALKLLENHPCRAKEF